MKKIFLYLIIVTLPILVTAQLNLDSLWNIWQDESQPDTTRLKAIQKFVWDGYLFGQPDSAYFFAEQQYEFAERKALKKYMASALSAQGISWHFRGDMEKALEYQLRNLRLQEEIGNKEELAKALGNVGVIYMSTNDFANAINYFNRSLEIQNETGDTRGRALSLGNLANIYSDQGKTALALEYYLEALKAFEEIKDQRGRAAALKNIGSIYTDQKEFSKALNYMEQSLSAMEEIGDKRGVSLALNAIGTIHVAQENHEESLEYFKRKMVIDEEIGNKSGIADALHNIGTIFRDEEKYDQALDYFLRSLKIQEEVSDKSGMASTSKNIGKLFNQKKESTKAIEWCLKGLNLSKESGDVKIQESACSCLYNAYKVIGESGKALQYYEQSVVLKDSLFNEENTKKITQLEMQYDFDKKEAATQAEQEKKDAVAAQELKRQKLVRNGFMGGFAIVLLFAGVFFTQRNRIGKEKKRSEELLLNILPEDTAQELKEKGHSDAQLIDQVTVLFTDFKGFTALSEKVTPKELVADLHECFSAFDNICEKYGIEKIKTIGDAYMAAGGLPTPNTTHAQDVVRAALDMAEVVENGKAKKIAAGLPFFEIRIGVHTGPVVAGIVGIKKFQYDIWGDTVNTASRMESSGEVGQVNISEATCALIKNQFKCEYRGELEAKGKGKLKMYFASRE